MALGRVDASTDAVDRAEPGHFVSSVYGLEGLGGLGRVLDASTDAVDRAEPGHFVSSVYGLDRVLVALGRVDGCWL